MLDTSPSPGRFPLPSRNGAVGAGGAAGGSPEPGPRLIPWPCQTAMGFGQTLLLLHSPGAPWPLQLCWQLCLSLSCCPAAPCHPSALCSCPAAAASDTPINASEKSLCPGKSSLHLPPGPWHRAPGPGRGGRGVLGARAAPSTQPQTSPQPRGWGSSRFLSSASVTPRHPARCGQKLRAWCRGAVPAWGALGTGTGSALPWDGPGDPAGTPEEEASAPRWSRIPCPGSLGWLNAPFPSPSSANRLPPGAAAWAGPLPAPQTLPAQPDPAAEPGGGCPLRALSRLGELGLEVQPGERGGSVNPGAAALCRTPLSCTSSPAAAVLPRARPRRGVFWSSDANAAAAGGRGGSPSSGRLWCPPGRGAALRPQRGVLQS